jgi:hypothetical protein
MIKITLSLYLVEKRILEKYGKIRSAFFSVPGLLYPDLIIRTGIERAISYIPAG